MRIFNPNTRLFIIIAILLACAAPFAACAQNKTADSLIKKLTATKQDTGRVILLNKIAFALYSTDYQKSLDYCKQADTLAGKLNYTKGRALNAHIQGVVYTFKDDYVTALSKEQLAASLALKTNDFALLAKAYNAAGLAYSRLNDSVRAMAAFNDAIAAMQRTRDKSYTAAILHNLAVLYIGQRQFARGLTDLLNAAELNKKNKNNQWLVQNYYWIGRAYYMQKQYAQSLSYESMAISIARQNNFNQPLVKSLGVRGDAEIALKNYPAAEKDLLEAEKIADDKKIASERLPILKSLANLYEQRHDLVSALVYQKKYNQGYTSSYNTEKTRLEAEYEARFQDKQRAIENELLKKDRAISEGDIKQRNYLLAITFLTIFLLIISTILVYVAYYKIKHKNSETELKNHQIADQNQQLEHLNQLKSKMLSVLAHDLRGPMNSLRSLLDLAAQGAIDSDEEKMLRQKIIQRVDENSTLINNLLAWGRSQLDGFHVSPCEFFIAELTNEIIEQLMPEANSKSIQVKNYIPAGIVVYADKEMIDMVMRNLINNAIKFTPANGMVDISANEGVEIQVKDSGIGMSAEQLQCLFKGDFYTTKTQLNPHGTGLGLQICKEFVEQNGGAIRVSSRPGKGSTFTFTLPAYAGQDRSGLN
jgi:signal transduction histidine kinase